MVQPCCFNKQEAKQQQQQKNDYYTVHQFAKQTNAWKVIFT